MALSPSSGPLDAAKGLTEFNQAPWMPPAADNPVAATRRSALGAAGGQRPAAGAAGQVPGMLPVADGWPQVLPSGGGDAGQRMCCCSSSAAGCRTLRDVGSAAAVGRCCGLTCVGMALLPAEGGWVLLTRPPVGLSLSLVDLCHLHCLHGIKGANLPAGPLWASSAAGYMQQGLAG